MTTLALSPPRSSLPVEESLTLYLAEIRKFPLLSVEEEHGLARDFTLTGNQKSLHRLVTSHLRLVVKVAMQYKRYGLPMADLIAEGNLGLIRAIQKFEPDKGFRLSTYAVWWIRAAVNEYVLNSWSLVKIGTASTRKRLFYNLRRMKAKLGIYGDKPLRDEQAEEIARTLDVSADDVLAMDARLNRRDGSLNAMAGAESDTERLELLVDERPDQESVLETTEERDRSHHLVHTALGTLNEREKDILTRRKLTDDPATLESLGEDYGLSRERIRQIEARALQKLETRIRELIATEHRNIRQALQRWKNPILANPKMGGICPA
ncbi:RNA polymerase factor sigma-32 [Haematospirillum sp. H1815]|uniref:RNA polymerase factor sigma-32 n=1 Tax=Haematospirillum sp. H1815 TaxID=2723108 RepID=UPI00143B73AD|nr:RNA polymerase factor sigma-32 [Haematospirillum sp. H1815]NKD77943.1 RNA polymerase factor sigma-32 [Haematospirillum sp. H1815]